MDDIGGVWARSGRDLTARTRYTLVGRSAGVCRVVEKIGRNSVRGVEDRPDSVLSRKDRPDICTWLQIIGNERNISILNLLFLIEKSADPHIGYC